MKRGNKVPVKIAAQLLGQTEQWVRIGMQRNLVDIGTAFKMAEGRRHKYTYNIPVGKLAAYLCRPVDVVIEQVEALGG